ncbi:hypothetical protein LO772_00310 [Yinghuangia sp. ASG 101]|uniref:hypothetical protein n=1 Tax=Yinghuangia sp. ASG 101 TaxID=2896848 RepID=UPI001E647132|nr:hypothetical protein [Yinghuangia sp. ASG 101]UGQ12094.1 hypothetical protein LO772_00310 [Yinghuangia sp. ASG 101]
MLSPDNAGTCPRRRTGLAPPIGAPGVFTSSATARIVRAVANWDVYADRFHAA